MLFTNLDLLRNLKFILLCMTLFLFNSQFINSPEVKPDYKHFQPTEPLKYPSALENKQLLFNPDCYIRIILDYVYEEVGIPNDVKDRFDIATDKGKLLKVNKCLPNIMGLDIFSDKTTYYIVILDDDNQIKPMLSEASREMIEFEAYQRRRSSQTKRRSSKSSQDSSLISNDTKLKMSQTKN